MLVMMLFFRNLPKLMRLFLQLFRQVLYLSYLIYYTLLTWIDVRVRYQLQINDSEVITVNAAFNNLLLFDNTNSR